MNEMNRIHGGKKATVAQFHFLCNTALTGVEHKTNLFLLLLVFSPWAGLGRDQSSVR